jgi:hypothetical protein
MGLTESLALWAVKMVEVLNQIMEATQIGPPLYFKVQWVLFIFSGQQVQRF